MNSYNNIDLNMFKNILLCSLLVHIVWTKPLNQHHTELVAPHVLIVTPQAQLRLDSLVAGTPVIHHLSPFTRYITPHEETIVYVPASAVAAIHNAEAVAHPFEYNKGKQISPSDISTAVGAIAASGAQSIQSGLENAAESATGYLTGTSTFVPTIGNPAGNLLQGAEAVIQGAQGAINSFQQAQQQQQQTPAQSQLLSAESPLIATEVSLPPTINQQKLPLISLPQIASTEQRLPIVSLAAKSSSSLSSFLQPILPSISIYTNEPRHHYVVAPAVQHIVDFVPGSILSSPVATTTLKARRSVLADEKIDKPLALAASNPASNNDIEKEELLLKEKKEEFKRFLEANALKEEIKDEQPGANTMKDIKLPEIEKDEKLILEKNPNELKSPPDAANKNDDETPSTKEA